MSWLVIVDISLGVIGSVSSVLYILERLSKMKKLSWKDATRAAEKISQEMSRDGFSPTVIVGIGRGGAIMGALISGVLGHRPLVVIDRKYTWVEGRRFDDMLLRAKFPASLLERVLLVSGETHTGNTMRLYHDYFKNLGAKQIKKASFFLDKGSLEKLDYVGIEGMGSPKMPWMISENYLKEDRSEEDFKKELAINQEATKHFKICYIIRHGETVFNVEDRFCGSSDPQLTENGLRQAEDVADYLLRQHERVGRVYTSHLHRALAFARVISSKLEAPLVIDDRLRELDYGEWEGLTRAEVEKKWSKLYALYLKNPERHRPDTSETIEHANARIKEFWSDLTHALFEEELDAVAIITHKDVGRLLLCNIKGIPLSQYRSLTMDNGSIAKVEIDNQGNARVLAENELPELR